MIEGKCLNYKYESFDSSEPANIALSEIDISIKAGEFVAILGHNGSGKSTLARHFNALLSPTGGTLWINGLDTKSPENTWEIRQSVGMVFQNPDNQIIATIVEEDVAFGPENLGVHPNEIRTRVNETLASVKMSDYALFSPHHLSGGQKQRVAIAGVLAMRPGCIVLDEPSAMLDPSGRREVMETIIRLNKESGITVILITHFMEEAAKAKRVIIMDSGKVVLDNTPRNIFSHVEKMQKLGLGVPQITALTHELRKRGFQIENDILSIDDFIGYSNLFSHVDYRFPVKKESDLPTNPVIKLCGVSHIYNANTVFENTALSEIDLSIFKGEIVAIIGHTGSGKSTLIQHFNALLKPSCGQVFIDGVNIYEDKSLIKKIRQRVGLVFQYPEHQLFETTVFKDVAFGPTLMGLSPEETEKNTIEALEAVGLEKEVYNKSPFELSGGQKRRAAIAGVLAMRPDVLVLDEPAAGLDPRGKEEIFSQIKKMRDEFGLTVILVSHSMDDAARLAKRILVMNNGKIVCDGTPEEIFAKVDFLKNIGLDTPQISQLMSRLNANNSNIPTNIFTVSAAADVLAQP